MRILWVSATLVLLFHLGSTKVQKVQQTDETTPPPEDPENRLLGGQAISNHSDFPYFVKVGAIWFDRCYVRECVAVVINEYHLLTVAHCFDWGGLYENTVAFCGDQWREVASLIRHPDYDEYDYGNPFAANDIALLTLAAPFDLTDDCQQAVLPNFSDEDFTDEDVTIVGFNSTDWYYPNDPMIATLTVLDDDTCTDVFNASFDGDIHICLQDTALQQAACFGDQASPAVTGNGTVIGMGSWIFSDCSNKQSPSVFVNVAYYLDWINQNI